MSGGEPPDGEFALFQDGIVERLKDREWFIRCIAHNYRFIARRYACHVHMSERRLGEAHDFWVEDSSRTLRDGIEPGTSELDHFKHASFIAFWLRRMLPINETQRMVQFITTDNYELSELKKFLLAGNEICSLRIGFQLCLFYESSKIVAGRTVQSIQADRPSYLRTVRFPPNLLSDFSMVLKHKNMSPHALYLLYRSLFETIIPRAS